MLPSDAQDARSTVPPDEHFCEDAVFDASNVFLPKAWFFRNGSHEMADVYARMRSQEPQIVEVARLVASPVLESHDHFGGDFVQAVHGEGGDLPVRLQIPGKCVKSEAAPLEKTESPRSGLTKLGNIAQLPKSYEH
jgi:hypothetical protein